MTIEQAFQTLELPASATFEQVKQTYRELIKVWHPDRFPGDAKFQARATRKVQDINSAYKLLETHYQNPPSTPPQPNNTDEMFSRWVKDVDKQQRQAEADRAAYSTLDELILHFANNQPYKVYPCHIQRSNDHSLTPERLWGFGVFATLAVFAVSYLITPVPTLLKVCIILTLTMKAIDWYGKRYLPPDALLLTDNGLTFIEGIRMNDNGFAATIIHAYSNQQIKKVKWNAEEIDFHLSDGLAFECTPTNEKALTEQDIRFFKREVYSTAHVLAHLKQR